jgi:hypothetical protein
MAGDSAWSDYTVAADVRFLSSSPAVLMGRIDSADVFQDQKARWPSGYIFSIAPDGSWKLFSATFKRPIVTLGGGATQIDRTRWHHLGLRFDGKHVEGMFDGKTLVSTDDTAHTHGMFALGTEWDHTQFDNLSVTTK